MATRLLIVGLFLFSAAAHGATASASYSGVPVAIPDAADLSGTSPGLQVGAPIVVSGLTRPVGSVTLSIDGTACSAIAGSTTVGIDHTFVNDLRITLRSPIGTEVVVINQTDGSGNNFCQVVLADASPGPSIQTVVTAQAPFTGSYKPNAVLAAFAGEPSNGAWTLLAQDFFSGDTGSIRAWTINVTEAAPVTATSIPTLSEWALIGLAGMLAMFGMGRMRSRV
ncbi:putative secreted protein (IPTL-CTERM system target) [Acidovorax sp. 69]|uniref:IPTL-CTERM sorting domain-containing protein n=1 Tax=Acidovorax sp. 69 TaxID=2035202 RepID=UPI000C23B4B7|nr:IPTL-CTERM sorting domain-containing protein [Acidovorax sp. 69]PJI98156.1 putative secreted protein (IPTL-CTERM system target) [Acidovorax sp. 69]